MLTRIVQQVNGLLMDQCTRLCSWVKAQLLPNAKQLLANITQGFLNVVNQFSRLAQTTLNIKAWPVLLTTLVQSIKAVLTTAKQAVIQIGSLLQTTARQTLQLVSQCLQQSKDKLAGLTKLGQSRLKGIGFALTRMELPLTQAGVKLQDLANQLQLLVKRLLKKDK